jgi:RimJ/RimL family protein N-acetyltransferase
VNLKISMHTERTVMLRAAASDLPTLSALWNDPGVRELMFDGDALGPAQAKCLLDAGLAQAQEGLGWWLVCPWNNSPALGCVGLLRSAAQGDAPPGEAVKAILAFGPEAWALGYAHEATKELVVYAVQRLGLPRVSVLSGVPDPMFDRLLRALGFRARLEADAGRRRLRLYELQGAPVASCQQTMLRNRGLADHRQNTV